LVILVTTDTKPTFFFIFFHPCGESDAPRDESEDFRAARCIECHSLAVGRTEV